MTGVADIVVWGAGGHGRVCAETAQAAGYNVVAFCDADAKKAGTSINGIAVVRAETAADLARDFDTSRTGLVIAVGNNATRMRLLAESGAAGFSLPAVVHPSAVVSPSAELGAGTVVVAMSVINANAKVGKGCILNTGCSIDHDNILEDGVQICPGVRSAGNVQFGENAFVGTGAAIVPGVRVGRRARVAAGTLVISDVGECEKVGRLASRPERG